MGSTDESASLNEVSTLPGMAKAPYLGTWVMKDKGMDSFEFFANKASKLVLKDPVRVPESSCPQLSKIWSAAWVLVRYGLGFQDYESQIKAYILTSFYKA